MLILHSLSLSTSALTLRSKVILRTLSGWTGVEWWISDKMYRCVVRNERMHPGCYEQEALWLGGVVRRICTGFLSFMVNAGFAWLRFALILPENIGLPVLQAENKQLRERAQEAAALVDKMKVSMSARLRLKVSDMTALNQTLPHHISPVRSERWGRHSTKYPSKQRR